MTLDFKIGVNSMGFRFRKSIKLAPGVRLNVTKKGISSVSVGKRGATVNIGKKGTRGTVGIPGSGLSYSSYKAHDKPLRSKTRSPSPHSPVNSVDQLIIGHTEKKVGVWLVIGILLLPIIFSWFTLRQGYSTVSRVVSMRWMIVTIFMLR